MKSGTEAKIEEVNDLKPIVNRLESYIRSEINEHIEQYNKLLENTTPNALKEYGHLFSQYRTLAIKAADCSSSLANEGSTADEFPAFWGEQEDNLNLAALNGINKELTSKLKK